MPKAQKIQPYMRQLIDTIDNDPELLMLLQVSHISENRKTLSSQLDQHFAGITGRRNHCSKDIYSDLLNFLW